MTPIVKSVIGAVSSITAVSAVVAPISVFSSRSSYLASPVSSASSGNVISPTSGGGEGSLEVTSTRNPQKISFNDLLSRITHEYNSKSGVVGKNDLPGKDSISNILTQGLSKDEAIWQLIKQDWKSCETPVNHMDSFCGFINLRKEGAEYKLRVARGNDEKYRIRIIKNENNRIDYYDDSYSNWRTQSNNNFSQLLSYNDSGYNSDPWQIYQEAVIVS